jgi:hypothetical protein
MSQHVMLISRHRHRASIRRCWSDPGDIVQYVIEVASRIIAPRHQQTETEKAATSTQSPTRGGKVDPPASINLLSKIPTFKSVAQELSPGHVSVSRMPALGGHFSRQTTNHPVVPLAMAT